MYLSTTPLLWRICLTFADIRLRPGSGGEVPVTTTGGVRSSAAGTVSDAAMMVARCLTQPSILSAYTQAYPLDLTRLTTWGSFS